MSIQTVSSAHQEIFLLLPWYVNGTLAPDEFAEVRAHFNDCLTCQHELEFLSNIERAATDQNDVYVIPQNAFASLIKRIEQAQSNKLENSGLMGRLKQLFTNSLSCVFLRPMSCAAFVSTMVFAVAIFFLWPTSFTTEPMYQTLSTQDTSRKSSLRFRVIFADDSSVIDARDLLEKQKVHVVVLQQEDGSYMLKIPPNADPFATASLLQELKLGGSVASVELILE